MKITIGDESKLKQLSQQEGILFSNLLRGLAIEDLLFRIYSSEYKEFLWLVNQEAIGKKAYREGKDDSLRFVYKRSEKKIFGDMNQPGQPLSGEVLQQFVNTQMTEATQGFAWIGIVENSSAGFMLELRAQLEDMVVPLRMYVQEVEGASPVPGKLTIEQLINKHPLTIQTYSMENALCEALYEILYKMELIGSMEAYSIMNNILKTQAISGRHVVEEMIHRKPYDEKFYKEKRLEQIAGYQTYAYMRKRWEQYQKKNKEVKDSWEDVMERLLKFLKPLWDALCKEEVFFDDWMPELERFLG